MLATQEEVRQRLAAYRVQVARERGVGGSGGVEDRERGAGSGVEEGLTALRVRGEDTSGRVDGRVDGLLGDGKGLEIDDENDDDDEDDDEDDSPSSIDVSGGAIISSGISCIEGEGESEDDLDLEQEDGQVVSEEEYMNYVRDADIECYLRGLLWVSPHSTYAYIISYTIHFIHHIIHIVCVYLHISYTHA